MSDSKVDIGYADFRVKVYGKYGPAIRAAQDLVELSSNISANERVSGKLLRVTGWIVCIITNSVGAVVTLVLNGYGNDAMKIARGIFEGAVTVSFLKLHPEAIEDFVDFHWVRQARGLEQVRSHFPAQYRRISVESKKHIMAEYERVSKAGRFKNKNGKDRNRWSDVPFSKMAEDVGLRDLYLTFYSWASSMHHSDFGGLSMQAETSLDREDTRLFCDVAPSEQWIDKALVVTHASVLKALTDYCELAKLDLGSELETANANFLAVWK